MSENLSNTAATNIREQARRQKRNFLIIKIMIRVLMGLSVLGGLIGFVLLSLTIGPGMFSEVPDYIYPVILVFLYAAFFVVPFLFCLPVLVPMALGHKTTNRIVVFRKFNNKASRKAIRKTIYSLIGNYGHVFTLSDANFKIKWYVKIPVFIGQMSFFHFRQRTIVNEKHLVKLEKTLSRKGWLNVNWLMSASKVFAVKTNDEYWKDTARLLLKECRLIVIDISTITEAITWELNMAHEQRLERNMIAIADEENGEAVKAWVQQHGLDMPLILYNRKRGLNGPELFEDHMVNILSRYEDERAARKTRPVLVRAMLTALVFIGVFMVIVFFLSPYLLPEYTGKHSPFAGQSVNAYVQLVMKSNDSVTYREVEQHIVGNWPEKAAAITIKNAHDHESAECSAVAHALSTLAHPSKTEQYIDLVEKGEPLMADTSFRLLLRLHNFPRDKTALRLLSNPRIDCKEKGLRLLKTQAPDSLVIAMLLSRLSEGGYAINTPPPQHEEYDGLGLATLVKNLSREDTYMERVAKFSLQLYLYLEQHRQFIDTDRLIEVWQRTPSKDIKSVMALLLLKRNNGALLGTVLDEHFVNNYYNGRLNLSNDSVRYLFREQPFRELVDEMILPAKEFDRLPIYDSLRAAVGSAGIGVYSAPMVSFLAKKYSFIVLKDFDRFINGEVLADFLYDTIRTGGSRNTVAYRDLVIANRQTLQQVLNDGSKHMKHRLNAAWLLAWTGDISVAGVAVEASKINEPWISLEKRYYPGRRAEEILKLLVQKVRGPFDKQPLIQLRQDADEDVQELLDALIRKAG